MEIINSTTRYTHKEKGGKYRILCVTKMKHPDNGEWIPCVFYESVIDNRAWVRSYQSFIDNFEDCYKTSSTTSPVGN